jgi:hypothetical protein
MWAFFFFLPFEMRRRRRRRRRRRPSRSKRDVEEKATEIMGMHSMSRHAYRIAHSGAAAAGTAREGADETRLRALHVCFWLAARADQGTRRHFS